MVQYHVEAGHNLSLKLLLLFKTAASDQLLSMASLRMPQGGCTLCLSLLQAVLQVGDVPESCLHLQAKAPLSGCNFLMVRRSSSIASVRQAFWHEGR